MTREEAIKSIELLNQFVVGREWNIALNMAIEALQEPERKHGIWKDFGYDNSYYCTVCGKIWALNDGTAEENNMNFCPNCGADMRGNEK